MEYSFRDEVLVRSMHVWLKGDLALPVNSSTVMIFAHGSGSSRLSTRNKRVAGALNERGIGTLLFDLLTLEEDMHFPNRFNIDLLANRLMGATEWLEKHKAVSCCRMGYFGASTGAAAALTAAAHLPEIETVISRGGRPDLAMDILPKLKIPVLLIVGSLDQEVLELNRKAFNKLNCEKELTVVQGAGHLFEEPGKMEEVIAVSGNWIQKHMDNIPVI